MTPDSPAPVPPDGEPRRWFVGVSADRPMEIQFTEANGPGGWVQSDDHERAVAAAFAAGRAAATPNPPDAADLVAAHLRERWPCTCRPGMDGGGVYHAADCNSRREGSQAVLAVIRLLRAATPPASPDERLREALARANDDLIVIADDAPEGVGEAIDSVRAAIKDALAAADREAPDEPGPRGYELIRCGCGLPLNHGECADGQ